MKDRSKKMIRAVIVAIVSLLLCFVMIFGITACGSEAPYIGDNGNWYVNGQDTGVPATGPAGQNGTDGKDGAPGADGAPGNDGAPGADGAAGDDGAPGKDGTDGTDGLADDWEALENFLNGGDKYEASTDAIKETLVQPTGVSSGNIGAEGKFYTDYETLEEEQQASKKLMVKIAEEGFVLLKNGQRDAEEDADKPLPFAKDERNITLFGIHSSGLVYGGVGSGAGRTDANGIAKSTLMSSFEAEGFSVNKSMVSFYDKYIDAGVTKNDVTFTELPLSYYPDSLVSTYAGYKDAAIVTFSRIGSENKDRATHSVDGHSDKNEHYLQLDDAEKDLINHVKAQGFKKIVVLLNSANIMQIPELDADPAISGIIWIGSPGNNGVDAVSRIISGAVNPSGRTSDLWEKDFKLNPTWTNFGDNTQNFIDEDSGERYDAFFYDGGADGNSANPTRTEYTNVEYREDIYLGYKYYETLYHDAEGDKEATRSNVLYDFGYGLDYTDFEWRIDNVATTEDITAANQTVTVRIWVKNTGYVAGKDVVQVYYNPPYEKGTTKIEKAAANLVGFAKTDLLKPGESQIVQVQFVAQDMASFDSAGVNDKGHKGYVLEAGDYEISLRTDSHNIKQGKINNDDDSVQPLVITRTVKDTIVCKTDLVTGAEIKPLFTGDYSSTNESLMNNKISRATGLKQPEPSSREDRTLTSEEIDYFDSQDTYFPYQDKQSDPWYVGEVPENWTQAASHAADFSDVETKLYEMAGIKYNEPSADASGKMVYAAGEYDEGTKKWEEFMNQLTWEELLILGNKGSGINAIESIGMPGDSNTEGSVQAGGGTMWTCAPITAATFNTALTAEMGRMIGNELIFNGKVSWHGPAMNTHRSPFSGRNFEYYSEDGVHAAKMVSELSRAVAKKGIMSTVKHFFLNDQETYRADYGGVSTWATEQAMREIYLKPFEACIKAGSFSVMSSFNRIGTQITACNWVVHEDLLRDEWGFTGSVVSDAWTKDYCPLNLMMRAGDEHPLGNGTGYPKNRITEGVWDAAARDGKGCVKVPGSADEQAAFDNTSSTEEQKAAACTTVSTTHYYAIRKAAQRLLYTRANNITNKNGFIEGTEIPVTLKAGVYNNQAITMDEFKDLDIRLADGAEMPEGLTFSNGNVQGTPTMASAGKVAVVVDCDGWVKNVKAFLSIKVESALDYNGTSVSGDATYNMKVGEACNVTIDSDYLAYGNIIPNSASRNIRIMNYYIGQDGAVYHRNEDKSAADIITIDASTARSATEYEFTIDGNLPDGLKADKIIESIQGYAVRGNYDVNTGLKISGTPTEAGTYTFTVNIKVPYVSKSANPWLRATATNFTYSQQITIVVQ